MIDAQEITKKAKSNLAFALVCLPKQRRQDMVTFYAFCRIIDDIADDEGLTADVRHQQLDSWKQLLRAQQSDEPFPLEVISLIQRYQLDTAQLLDIIEGCRSDIDSPPRYQTWEQLQQYTYRVACCVGLISTKIFGCQHPDSEAYAIKLGHALQLTNILRDVGHDLKHGDRIYLPLEEFSQFDYTEEDLRNKVYDQRFTAMMEFQAQRAIKLFDEATSILPAGDAKALRPAESMKRIYYDILQQMRKDKFQVFSKVYKLSKWKKIYHLIR